MKKILLVGILFSVLTACGSGHPKHGDGTSNALEGMMAGPSLEIISTSAQPLMTAALQQLGNAGLFVNGSTAGNIDLSNNSNFLRVQKDSVMAMLPFYGERRFGGGYNSSSGIEFAGVPEDLHIQKGKASSYEIRFSMNDKNANTDNYRVFIKLFPNLTSTISITSSSRSSIQYRGQVYALKNDK